MSTSFPILNVMLTPFFPPPLAVGDEMMMRRRGEAVFELFLAKGIPQMPKLEKLWVEYYRQEHSVMLLTAFLRAAPQLQEFSISQLGGKIWQDTSPHAATNVERGLHRHLKVFEFRGFCGELDDHIELVTYISDNCIALQKMILGCCLPLWEDEPRAVINNSKQRLQGKIPHHVQLTLPEVPLPHFFMRHDSSI